MSVSTGDLVSRVYGNFRGVDFRGEEINIRRSPDSKNVWKDYKMTESIRTRPGLKLLTDESDRIGSISFYKGYIIVYADGELVRLTMDGQYVESLCQVGLNPGNSFVYNDIFYYLGDGYYIQYDGEKVKDVVGYVPTTSIGRRPTRQVWEDTFLADGKTKTFKLAYSYIDKTYTPVVMVDGQRVVITEGGRLNYSINYSRGEITFQNAPNAPVDGEGNQTFEDNILVRYKKIVPGGGGTIHEDVNMLSPYRINTFLSDGISTDFYLDVTSIDKDFEPIITLNDEIIDYYDWQIEVDYDKGLVHFTSPPDAPNTDGQDNVKIKFKKTLTKDDNGNTYNLYVRYRACITNCTLLQVFDNRVFVSGNPNYPNTVWHCSLNDPSYFSDLDYYREGMDEAKITGLVAGNNALWVFREPGDSNTNVFYHTPTIDAEYGKIYPSSHSSITIGCIGKAINFNDDIVFFSERGMEGISGDVTTEQAVAHRSSLVDRKMIAHKGYANMILEEWEGYLLVIIGNAVYLADSRTAFTNEGHIEYDWFYWELEENINCAKVYEGVLYLGTDYGIYTMSTATDDNGAYIQQTDDGAQYESYWVTPKDKFNSAHQLKTTNKRGCVAEATGDVDVYVKTEDTDFELIGRYEDVTDYFVSRIKRKKFKDIQLKFLSTTSFSLETVTLECFIGGYIKR